MGQDKTKLSGVFAPVVTPFRDDELALDDLRFNLGKLNGTKLSGYFALGSNGECKSLSDREQAQVLEVFARHKGDKVVMVGTYCESTKETVERSKRAAEMGFDYVSVLPPGYFASRMDDATLRGYYERIADSVSVPVILYNAPGFAGGVQISPQTVAALSRHPNIVGIKDTSSTGPGRFPYQELSDSFHVLAGSASFFYPYLHLGAVGGVLSLANVLPDPCAELYSLFVHGRYDEARQLHFRLARVTAAISGPFGVAGVKTAMETTGFRGGEPRHPLTPLTAAQKGQIAERLRAEGFIE